MRKRTAVILILLFGAVPCRAQRITMPPGPVQNHSLSVMGGWSWPLSHDGLTKFWGSGPSGSLRFLTSVNRYLSLGFDLEGSAYWFRGPVFAAQYPALTFRNPPVAQIVAGVSARLMIAPSKRLSPYVGGVLGISHMTGAEYRQLTDSTSSTYYYIPFQTRLAVGLYAGLEYRIVRSLAFDVEARWLYVNNDPDVGANAVVRGGLRFIF